MIESRLQEVVVIVCDMSCLEALEGRTSCREDARQVWRAKIGCTCLSKSDGLHCWLLLGM